eukprot:765712-Hanusia_phi.AAC.1
MLKPFFLSPALRGGAIFGGMGAGQFGSQKDACLSGMTREAGKRTMAMVSSSTSTSGSAHGESVLGVTGHVKTTKSTLSGRRRRWLQHGEHQQQLLTCPCARFETSSFNSSQTRSNTRERRRRV